MLMSPMRDGRTTSEDSATQLLICEPLSFAISLLTMIVVMGSQEKTQAPDSRRDYPLPQT